MSGVDSEVAKLVAALHTGTWFTVGELQEALLTQKGGRQGCKLGSL